MLTRLSIQDVVLVDRLDLDIRQGLSVLTGETGAGKSIILDSLGLATGARGDAGLIRAGAPQASVTAEFDLGAGHPLYEFLEDKGLAVEPGEPLLLRRVVSRDGRSKAFVNDQSVSVSVLKALGDGLLEVHGQHETVGLLDPRTHGAMLDAYGGCEGALVATAAAFRTLKALRDQYRDLKRQSDNATAEIEELTLRLQELDRLNPLPDEEAQLASDRALLGASERALEDINEARTTVGGDQLSQRLSKAFRALDHARTRAQQAGAGEGHAVLKALSDAAEALDRTLIAADEALALMDAAADALDVEPGKLDRVEERLFALRAMARKLNILVEDLPRKRAEIAQSLGRIEDADAELKKLAAAIAAAEQAFNTAVENLRQKRLAAGEALSAAVMAELVPLKLDKAAFRVNLRPLEPEKYGATGGDVITFEVRTNPGADWGGMAAIASGGELARFALALKAALSTRGGEDAAGPVMIFDEVDQGVGGAVADAVGLRLRKLAQRSQVIVVTHSPQVAARGDQHLKVSKADAGEGMRSRVVELNKDETLEELARMLSGAEITPEARAAAIALVKG
ncbi:DNA repair protein RecN [Asticcacaulis excentricus]|uniref:DNA repair protein RecN n=1 Tax=Asticcacaulis excentricus (strain ATCC 15261 / DSM 4724 / KCTC 12464 / NCIMB 9791 / VKM B-1370 / CB 48) TaxID=573065 RepID=E8RR17_ASTEC|nr:DNA repair protein RecN [Asticcacaulis excentricus]ADU13335.1 DNA repair protein RecN [Asticcacaulis excentricus CB 48]